MARRQTGLRRAREIFLFSDSEPNEVLIGVLHCAILPFAMFELGTPWVALQIGAHMAGVFQLFCVLYNGTLRLRSMATKVAALVSVMTVANYTAGGLMHGSNFGWLLICVFAFWNVVRVERERMQSWRT